MRTAILHAALAHIQNRRQGGEAGDVVDHDAAGEVPHAPLLQEASAPYHVHEREVNEGQPRGQEQHVGLERDAVGEGARDQGRRDDGKHHLKGDEDHRRDGVIGRRRVQGYAAQTGIVEIADDAMPVAAEAQRIAVEIPNHGGPAHRDKTLDHDGQDVLAADQAAVEERQSRGHEHDQAGAENHETGVAGVKV